MNEEAAFLKAIEKNPDDRTARLVFADWLQERDDSRAAWVRDDDIWAWMKPDAKDPTEKLIRSIRRGHKLWKASQLLGRLGSVIVPAVLTALREIGAADYRSSSFLKPALKQVGHDSERHLPLLLAAVKENNEHVRGGAFQCLTGLILKCPEALDVIIAGFDSAEMSIRHEAFTAINEKGQQKDGPERLRPAAVRLHEIVRAGDDRTSDALHALGHMRGLDKSLIPLLVSLVGEDCIDDMASPNAAAAHALGDLGLPAAEALLRAAKTFTGYGIDRTVRVLQQIGPVAAPLLRAALKGRRSELRHLAAVVLPKLPGAPDIDAISGLIEALRSEGTRDCAVAVVRDLGPTAAAALPVLLEIIERTEPYYRLQHVASALVALGPAAQSAVPALLDFVGRLNSSVCTEVGRILDQLGHGPSALIVALGRAPSESDEQLPLVLSGDEFEGVRDSIIRAHNTDSAARAVLREVARHALRKSPAAAVRAILPFLSDKSLVTRLVAVFALRHIGTSYAVTGIVAALKDKNQFVRVSAVRALARVGTNANGVLEALRAATKDRAKDVREAATKALAELTPKGE